MYDAGNPGGGEVAPSLARAVIFWEGDHFIGGGPDVSLRHQNRRVELRRA